MGVRQAMNQRILVVDDDTQIVRLVQSYLEQAGYAVLTAYDGAAALRHPVKGEPRWKRIWAQEQARMSGQPV